MPSVSVAVTWSEPEGKFKIPENVPARLGTWVPVNVPESEQLELVPEYVPELVVPLRVPCPVKTFPPSLKVRVMLLPLTRSRDAVLARRRTGTGAIDVPDAVQMSRLLHLAWAAGAALGSIGR